AVVLLFRASVDRWGAYVPPALRRRNPSAWGYLICGAGAGYLLYRVVGMASGNGDLPPSTSVTVGVLIVALVMALLDGALLAWVLVEFRNASLGDTGNEVLDTDQATGLMPGAALACVAGLPARYVATMVYLFLLYLPSSASDSALFRYIRWQ